MKTSPVPPKREVYSCPTPIAIWRDLLTYLLAQHYRLTVNDTVFSNDTIIQEHIEAGISLADALNFIVEKFDLVRIDRRGFSCREQSPFVTVIDILRARQACGLMSRRGYRAITQTILGDKQP